MATEHQDQIDELQKALAGKDDEHVLLQQRIQTLLDDQTTVATRMEALQAILTKLTEEIKDLQQTNVSLTSQLQSQAELQSHM